MTVQIFTTVVNRPDFVKIQKNLFDKFLLDEYQFHVIDDSIDSNLESQFQHQRVLESFPIELWA